MKFLNHNLFTGDITVNGTTTLSTATGVTRATGDNSTHLATTAFVKAQDYATNTALGNYVPISRTLTINNVTYDLSANRSWTIGNSDYTSVVKHAVKAGVAITKGQAIYVTSADGTNMIVGLASNASEATSSKTMGLAETTVAINGFTNVVTEGLLAGLNTVGANAGDPVWLGTGGNLIYGLLNKPYAPAHLVFIGIVTRVNANNGEIFVKIQNGFELDELHDVDLKTNVPVNGEILGFNGTLWVNKTIATWLGYTPANASGTTNYVSKFTGTTTLGNSQIFDNGTNVGIGATSPNARLDVATSSTTGTTSMLLLKRASGYGHTLFEQTYDSTYFTAGKTLTLKNDAGTAFIHFAGNNAGTQTNVLIPTGNVGIGTTSPSDTLDLYQAANTTAIRLTSAGVGSKTYRLTSQLIGVSNAGFGIQNATDGRYELAIDGSGNVGIGTTAPLSKLQVSGGNISFGTRLDNVTRYIGKDATGGTFGSNSNWIGFNSTTNQDFITFGTHLSGTGGGERMRIDAAGRVGIGTTAPTNAKVHIVGDGSYVGNYGYNTLTLEDTGGYPGINLRQGNNNWLIRKDNSQNLQFVFSSNASGPGVGTYSPLINITSSGNVGIGIATPTNKLQVANGNMSITTGYSFILADTDTNWRLGRNIIVESGNYLTGSTFQLVGANAVSEGWQFVNDDGFTALEIGGLTAARHVWINAGNLSVGVASPQEKIHVVGNVRIDGGSTAAILQTNDATAAEAGTTYRTFTTADHYAVFVDYVVYDAGRDNMRTGTFRAVWSTGDVVYTDVSTVDLGATDNVTLTAAISGANVNLIVTGPADYTLKYSLKVIK